METVSEAWNHEKQKSKILSAFLGLLCLILAGVEAVWRTDRVRSNAMRNRFLWGINTWKNWIMKMRRSPIARQ